MKVLAIDTSSTVAAVAIIDNDKLLGEYIVNHKNTHSQKLMPMIKELMDKLELTSANIDIFAVSSGPGSFTGLRIGAATIKALAYATDKPVVSVPTLDALAYNIQGAEQLICPIMDARNNQVYTALYRWEKNRSVNITEYLGIPISELVQIIKDKDQKVIFTGDAVEIHKDYLKGELNDSCMFANEGQLLQKASSVARLALIKASEGKIESSFDMVPFYLRKTQAERELEKRHSTGAV